VKTWGLFFLAKAEYQIRFTAPPTIRSFMDSEASIRGVMGPVGSGKSSGAVIELYKQASTIAPCHDGKRRFRGGIIRGTYRQLLDTTVKTWLEWFPEDKFGPFHKNEMAHRWKMKGLEAEFLFRALDKPQDIDNLLSLDLTMGWINEARETPFEILSMLDTRVGRYPRRVDCPVYRSGIILDTNPPADDHWWHRLAEEIDPLLRKLWRDRHNYADPWEAIRAVKSVFSGDEFASLREAIDVDVRKAGDDAEKAWASFRRFALKYRFFRQPSGLSDEAENVEHLRPGYYTDLCIGKSPEWINVYVKGQYGFVVEGKPVYPEYNDAVHFNPDLFGPLKGFKILRGWDFGRTPACSLSYVDAKGRWRVFDELTSQDMGIDEFGDIAKKHCAQEYPGVHFVDYCDPSGFYKGDKDDSTCAQILSAKGIDVEPGLQNPTIRINSVSRALRGMIGGLPEFQIGPKCKMLRKGFQGAYCYRRKQVSGEVYTDVPDKGPTSHVHDSLQYVGTRLYSSDLLDGTPHEEEEPSYYEEASMTGASAVCGY
jgi:hypothetical protein